MSSWCFVADTSGSVHVKISFAHAEIWNTRYTETNDLKFALKIYENFILVNLMSKETNTNASV